MVWTEFLAPTPTLLVGVGGALLLWLLVAPDEQMRAIRGLPRPASTLPLLGNTLDLMAFQLPRLHDWITEQCLAHRGQPWVLRALGAPALVVMNSVALFEDVLKTQFAVFDKGPRMTRIFREVMGDGIVAVDGDKWKEQRRALSHLFSMRRFRDSMWVAVETHLQTFARVLDAAAVTEEKAAPPDEDSLVDLGSLFHRFAFDVFGDIAFGRTENTLEHGDTDEFLAALTEIGALLELRFHQPDWLWQLKSALNIGTERRLHVAVRVLDKNVYGIISEAMASNTLFTSTSIDSKLPSSSVDPNATPSGIALILAHLDEFKTQEGITDTDPSAVVRNAKYLRDIGVALVAGGKDTTGNALSWLLVMLAQHPRVLATVRDELMARLPRLFTDRSYVPTMDDIDSLVYLEAVIRESLRLNPLVPLNAKEANRDVTLCDGTFLRKGTRVYIPSYALARLPEVWGADAAEFNPERWLDREASPRRAGDALDHSSLKLRTFSPFQFIAFHAGPRACLGKRFALMELKMTASYLLSKFEFTHKLDPHQYRYEMATSLVVQQPVLVWVKRLNTAPHA